MILCRVGRSGKLYSCLPIKFTIALIAIAQVYWSVQHVGLSVPKDASRRCAKRLDEIRQHAEPILPLRKSKIHSPSGRSPSLTNSPYQYREEEREMNKYCHETGVGLIPWAPLYRGHLARPLSTGDTVRSEATKSSPMFRDLSGQDPEIIKRVEELAEKKGWKMSQVALAWIIQKNTIPIVGFSNLSRLDEACEVKGKTLTDEDIKYLEELYEPKAISGHA